MYQKLSLLVTAVFAGVFFILQNSSADYPGLLLEKAPIKKDIKLNSEVLEEIILLPEEPFDEPEARQIIYRLDHLPPRLLHSVQTEGIMIRLFQDKLTSFPTTQHLKGVTPRGYTNTERTWDEVPGIGGSKLVLVKIGHSEKGSGHGSINLELHELAHSINRYVLDDLYYRMKFTAIWKQEAHLLFPEEDYFLNYEEEYFAEAFAMYYLNLKTNEELEEKAPATHQFFAELESM
ncbi:anthrax toxin lethal factor-related metalloendopeptidase [Rossellomorea vietnamensis]|uniref:Toxin n=1 Tax=Rossellomorea aquimaris TaxID=189382 RepID=A0A5D4TX23_9BACI|nr:toxin [Rossellomorea aquimaris]TYS79372.1 toxin [Rossellomorea aquimaris]